VDGYNVLLRLGMGQGEALQERRDQLIARIAGAGLKAWVVFDSPGSGPREQQVRGLGRVSVRYTSEGKSADDVLLQRVQQAKDLRDVAVVTDDVELARRCRFHGAEVVGVDDFADRFVPEPGSPTIKERPLSRAEIDEWLRYFGQRPEPPNQ
jgi:predicted RNA-binding protein with PIN domain